MKISSVFKALLMVFLVTLGVSHQASAQDASRLGADLTPLGAERAGNADGTIPAWEGGITTPPAGYSPGMHHPDPFPDDAPRLTITAENMAQYEDVLSPGQRAMLARYSDSWKLSVYPTRRSASYPPEIYDAVMANAQTAELTEGGNGVRGATRAIAFPMPTNGLQAIWNHLLRYRGESVRRVIGQATPSAGGRYTMVTLEETILFPYARPGATIESINNRLAYFLQEVTAPPRLAGRILLVHETLDQAMEPRKAWLYNPGQRRVRRAPNVAYDNPGTASDGQRTSDQLDMFNGAPDRYNWELKGKREMIVPYNTYKLHSDQVAYDEIVQAGHLNPDLLRYELHRVWVVEATLKEGTSNIYSRRTFYLDEDSWQILAVDQYDARGEIWRYSEAYCIDYYELPVFWDTVQCHYDLQNGRYLAFGLNNEGKMLRFGVGAKPSDFTPESLRRKGKR